jgi:hypothetical protein
MKTAVVIYEDNHGMVGLAVDYESAIDFLVLNEWLSPTMELLLEDNSLSTIEEDLGENWLQLIRLWTMKEFNNYFDGLLYLDVERIYDKKEVE